MLRVIITDHGFPTIDNERRVLESAGIELEEATPKCVTEDDVIERCKSADGLIVQWAPITRRVLQALPRVKCIVRYGIGVDNFDLQAAKDLGVTAINVPDFCIEEVSNHAMAMILSLGRRIPHDNNQIRNGGWGINQFRPIPAFTNMTLGLVSFGKIARRTAEKAKAFGFTVIAYDPKLSDSVFDEAQVSRVELDALLSKSDIVSLHCPLLPETKHLINRDSIAKMKKGAILVNTSRGPLVKEADLIEALESGHIAGAGLDVFEQEPLPTDSLLRKLPNTILTSHAAWLSEHSIHSLQTKAAEGVRDFFEGKRPASALVWVPYTTTGDKA